MTRLHEMPGGCHCGNIRFTYGSPVPPAEVPVRACDCSFCRRQGAYYTSNPGGRLRAVVREGGAVRKYRYATLTSEAWICAKCGCLTFFTCDLDGKLYAAINVNSFDDFQFNRLTVPTLSLSDEPVEKRLARRQRAWIGDVEIELQT